MGAGRRQASQLGKQAASQPGSQPAGQPASQPASRAASHQPASQPASQPKRGRQKVIQANSKDYTNVDPKYEWKGIL